MQASLKQLWSLINSQQMIVYVPLYKQLKIPANSMIII